MTDATREPTSSIHAIYLPSFCQYVHSVSVSDALHVSICHEFVGDGFSKRLFEALTRIHVDANIISL